jgi:hypothetical protein
VPGKSDIECLIQAAAILKACIFCADDTERRHRRTVNSLHAVRTLIYHVFARAWQNGVDTERLGRSMLHNPLEREFHGERNWLAA